MPTNDDFEVEPTWAPLLDGVDPDDLRPPDWPGRGYGRAADGRPLWFVAVGPGLAAEELAARAVAVVRAVAAETAGPSRNRVRRLLAVPILGIEGGGHEHDRGEVVRRLLDELLAAVAEVDLDVAVVSPERSVYAAAQYVRGEPRPAAFSAEHLDHARRLGGLARDGDLALFFGAGVSVPAGLPGWTQMLRLLAERAGVDQEALARLALIDQAQLIQRRTTDLGKDLADLLGGRRRPSLAHALLAGLRCREAVTTNYDALYESAVRATGGPAPRVLPWETSLGASWVLKLHGDLDRPDSVTLSRRDFVRYDALTRPTGALLQALLLTRHLLLVGVSLDDDNVVRLVREVEVYRDDCGLAGPIATLLDVDADEARRELWQDPLDWLTMPGDDLAERTRALEIFLDVVAWHASDTSSWLLDPRFSGLLDPAAADLAAGAVDLRRRAESAGPEWDRLRTALDEVGAPRR